MFEKVKDFLGNGIEISTDEENKNLESLRVEKADQVWFFVWELTKHKDAFLDKEEGNYKERLLRAVEHPPKKQSKVSTESNDPCLDDDFNIKVIELFLSSEYTLPSNNLIVLQNHLIVLWNYYCWVAPPLSDIPLSVAMRIDFVMAQVISVAATAIILFPKHGYEQDRISASKKSTAERISNSKQMVLYEYVRIERRSELTPNRIAIIIEDRINKKGKKAPHPDTIKNYLRQEGKI